MKKKNVKTVKKMVKKIIRKQTDSIIDIICDELDPLAASIGAIRRAVESNKVKSAEPIMYTAELDSTDLDLEYIVKKTVKKAVKKSMKKYEKETDNAIDKYLEKHLAVTESALVSAVGMFVVKKLREAGLNVKDETPQKECDEESQEECCKCGTNCGIIVKPVSSATGPERDLLKSILGMIGYSTEDLDKIFDEKEEDADKEDEDVADVKEDESKDAVPDKDEESNAEAVDEEPAPTAEVTEPQGDVMNQPIDEEGTLE